MYVILRDGTVIENAKLTGAGPGNGGMSFFIYTDDGGYGWYSQDMIQTIRFDRDTVDDPTPEPGPEDMRIGTRHEGRQGHLADGNS